MKRTLGWLLLALCLITTTAAGKTETATEAGAEFPVRIEVDETTLDLAGTGVSKYRVIFTVCAVALYVPEGTARDAVLDADTPRRLEIEYFHEIPPEDIIRASTKVLDDQLSDSQRRDVADDLQRWHDAYRKVADGDRYSMTYLPDQGTTLRFNGEPIVSVSGPDFARTYFGIWLKDQSPLSKQLRRKLLKGLDDA